MVTVPLPLARRVEALRNGRLLYEAVYNVDTEYIGDLEAGKRVAWRERSHYLDADEVGGNYVLYLCDGEDENEGCTATSVEEAEYHAREVGRGPSEEDAWRYALGAMFGPIDSDYDEQHLRTLLLTAIDPTPDLTDPEEVEAWLER